MDLNKITSRRIQAMFSAGIVITFKYTTYVAGDVPTLSSENAAIANSNANTY